MPLHSVEAGNFKGLCDTQTIPIKPLTIFLGPNSSGKSSAIHAMACLMQSLKLPNNDKPVILDDEFAHVHLGRFSEVSHKHSYAEPITLGLGIGPLNYTSPFEEPPVTREGDGSATYHFKCSKRTQEIVLQSGVLRMGHDHYPIIARQGQHYDIGHPTQKKRLRTSRRRGFLFEWQMSAKTDPKTIFSAFSGVLVLQAAIEAELRRTLYLGPFRQSPLRRYPTRGSSPTEVGAQGEATITLLANESVTKRTRPHIKQISKWLAAIGLAKGIDVSRVGTSDLFDVSLTLPDDVKLPIADLGYGLSQVLPVLTQCSFAPKGGTLLFEQPELHLHPLASRQLATVFIETIAARNVHIVAETHSRELFGQMLTEMRSKRFRLADFAAYAVRRIDKHTVFRPIGIDPETFDTFEDPWNIGLDQ